MGRSRYRFGDLSQPHFMTCTVLHWIPVFTRPETVGILLDSLRFLSREGFRLYAYVILENHMHLIAQSEHLDHTITRFKSIPRNSYSRFSKRIGYNAFSINSPSIRNAINAIAGINSGRRGCILNG